MKTPVMSPHARERCEEMGISTKVAKRILRNADLTRPGNPGTDSYVATWTGCPQYAVVYGTRRDGRTMVITVLFNARDFYRRAGRTYVVA